MKIDELLDGINKKAIVLPEFGEYGGREQQKLISSLINSYLWIIAFWKRQSSGIKNITDDKDHYGMFQDSDGQQRLTLYIYDNGEIRLIIPGRYK